MRLCSEKKFNLALVVGRFQMFHNGHKDLIDTALMLADRVVVGIGSQQEKGTQLNPFSVWDRFKMISKTYHHCENIDIFGIDDLRVKVTNDIMSGGNLPDLMVYGDDKMRTDWFKVHIKSISRVILSRDRNSGISATELRENLVTKGSLKDFYQTYQKYLPSGTSEMIVELKEKLVKIDYYKRLMN